MTADFPFPDAHRQQFIIQSDSFPSSCYILHFNDFVHCLLKLLESHLRMQVVLQLCCRLISRTSESLSMFTIVHLALPAHVMSCPNIMFDWKCVNMEVQHGIS